ncbi:hypothetical protein HG530_014468 [Fusarium avenaceum]|nr:hypothetical protein HG530_014468 [Fusarium avenaceum]
MRAQQIIIIDISPERKIVLHKGHKARPNGTLTFRHIVLLRKGLFNDVVEALLAELRAQLSREVVTQKLRVGQNNAGKSLVELPDCNLILGNTGALEGNGDSLGGSNGEIDRGCGGISVTANLSQDARAGTILLGNGLASQNEGAGTVVESRCVGSSNSATSITNESRLECGDLVKLDVGESLIGVDDGLALA